MKVAQFEVIHPLVFYAWQAISKYRSPIGQVNRGIGNTAYNLLGFIHGRNMHGNGNIYHVYWDTGTIGHSSDNQQIKIGHPKLFFQYDRRPEPLRDCSQRKREKKEPP